MMERTADGVRYSRPSRARGFGVRVLQPRPPVAFRVTLENDEDGWVVADCPALPGCASQGRTDQEALANIKEAIIAWLGAEDMKADIPLEPGQRQVVVTL